MRVLILGYGDVGRTAARILISRGVETVVVDKTVDETVALDDGAELIKADVTNETFWEEIEIGDFEAAIVALPDDLHAIFCILALKNKNRNMKIYARCNNVENVEKMYAAGADYVIVLPIVTAEMILSEIFGESIRRKMTFENIDVVVYTINRGSRVLGKTLRELENYGVIVIAAECGGEIITELDAKIREGCRVAVAGRKEDLIKIEVELSMAKEKD
ncbi:potassium channel family protein [Archaeoglobus neptunius]|uniref:potassium channel family protein n=1 Tax=Archaeoglobus neptunius TaxID=2798580 RepID=UPI0019284B20|nr:NAD-binding protein [Archaeoglobus neptunius]